MARKPGKAPVKRAEIADSGSDVLTFDNVQLFKDLCGPHDSHLLMIEKTLRLRIDARGNRLVLTGGEDARARANSALESLYRRLQEGFAISAGDVDAALRLANPSVDPVVEKVPTDFTLSLQKRTIAPRSQAQRAYLQALREQELVFGVGPAGTGKTYLAVAWAAHLLLKGDVERIILSRPALEAGERIGFLPGDMKEKVDPYLRPLYDALYDVLHTDFVDRRMATGDIEIAPLGFMRGRTLSRAAVILDEAQNASVAQMKMFLTRLGEGSRMVITGDPSQTDLPPSERSGLADAIGLLSGVKGVSIAKFTAKDVVRHELVARIVNAYDKRDSARRKAYEKGKAEDAKGKSKAAPEAGSSSEADSDA
ncbi:PhoH family protein [Parvularcula flava]|uniref:PhoH-like protein n=1 Tax=Aquisalinus luteolus TaxID=1566827 RepID=A0A8J3A2E7_9PROT|nr:PhoH family protein [Aquisalinus luteolus]NHK28263.1 PhoH family protein [Aquisalinus luteolus]GGH97955.1 phosphate starvation protein PhoH [Aquisalinus luteolus]